MSWQEPWKRRWAGLSKWFRARKAGRVARERDVERVERSLLDAPADLDALRAAIRAYPTEPRVLRAASRAAGVAGRLQESELLARLADAPDDPTAVLDLGLHWSEARVVDLAVVILDLAVELNPLDAVARSALALCLAQSGAHARVVEVLALHPCLATDPGALFQFGWSALESGDHATARAALRQLDELGDAELRDRLEGELTLRDPPRSPGGPL